MKIVLENLTKIFPSRNKKAGEEVVAVNDFSNTIFIGFPFAYKFGIYKK